MTNGVNKYVKASTFYILGNGIGQGLVFLSSYIFVRIMSKADYGLYGNYYSIVSILGPLVGANLFVGLNIAFIDYKKDIKRFRSSNLFLSTLVLLAISVIASIINLLTPSPWSLPILILALLHAYGFFVINYFNYSANMENKYLIRTLMLVLPNVLQIGLSVLFIFLLPFSSMYSRVLGSVAGIFGCAIILYFVIIRQGNCIYNKEYWSYGLKVSVPSILSSISYMIMFNLDNVMVTHFKGSSDAATYIFVFYIGYILYAILQATSSTLQAWLYRVLDSGATASAKPVQKWYLIVFDVFAIGLMMIAPEVIKFMSPESYWAFELVAPFIIGSYLMVMYKFHSIVGEFHKKNLQLSVCVSVAAITNTVLNYLLIPLYGGIAASLTTVFSYLLLFILMRSLSRRLNKDLFSDKLFIASLSLVVLCGIIYEFTYSMILTRYIVFMLVLCLIVIYSFVKRSEWLDFIKKRQDQDNENT